MLSIVPVDVRPTSCRSCDNARLLGNARSFKVHSVSDVFIYKALRIGRIPQHEALVVRLVDKDVAISV